MMKKNIGGLDRIVRIIVGVILIGAAITGQIGIWGYIGVIPLTIALLGRCPAYLPFGISTRCHTKSCCQTGDDQ